MSKEAHEHKIAVIKKCIQQGYQPEETAQVFRKHAEILNACCDAVVKAWQEDDSKEGTVKEAWAKNLAWLLPLMAFATPPLVASVAGNVAGNQGAKMFAKRNELSIPTYQKVDEIMKLKAETADILDRVEANKKKQKEKANDRSVRSLF